MCSSLFSLCFGLWTRLIYRAFKLNAGLTVEAREPQKKEGINTEGAEVRGTEVTEGLSPWLKRRSRTRRLRALAANSVDSFRYSASIARA
jgi:hypothetical protein